MSSALQLPVLRWRGSELPFCFEKMLSLRAWKDRMISEVHEHASSIFQWHPGTSVRSEFLGPDTVVEKPWFLPKEFRPQMGEIGQEKGVFTPDYKNVS